MCPLAKRFASVVKAVALALLGVVTGLSAQEVDEVVISSAQVLSGRAARTEIIIPVFGPLESPEVSLDLDYSEMLDTDRSLLTIQVNDRPLRSIRLSEIGRTLAFRLPPEAGFQRVSIEARLTVQGDPCLLDYRDSAWLTLLPSSRVRYRQGSTDGDDATSVAVAEIVERWTASGATAIQMDVPETTDPDLLLALVDIDHLVRGWGLEPRYDGPMGRGEPRLQVTIGVAEAESPWQSAAGPDEIAGIARAEGTFLELHAHRPDGISRMAQLLGDPEAYRLCPGSTCMVGASFRASGTEAPSPRDRGAAYDLVDAGFPEGWVAAGAGRHQLQMVWPRPPWWRLHRWPELRLRARVASPDDDDSRLTVHLNGQPLASYALSERENDVVALSVRIPPQFWTADEWIIQVAARLEESRESCVAADPDALWMVLEPESGLYVPRTEERFDGIAEYHEFGRVPTLTGDPTIFSDHFANVAAVLYPYRARMDASRGFLWDPECDDDCLELVPVGSGRATGSIVEAGEMWVLDRSGALRIPLLPEPGHYQLARTEVGLLLAAPRAQAEVTVPDFSALLGPWALFVNGSWVAREADAPTGLVEVGPTGEETLLLSEEQQRARFVNFLWLCVVIASAAGGSFWIWRTSRDRASEPSDHVEFSRDH
ncbi:MAG: cellulose biosynthesis cyclic di-GMP-binding regulatory protein BcsB [Gemmatimonadota bacterium]|nr:cellulose biosynthesis cyclic di-GMP-binding regulatory protein BcsB [Gemmatimonadota bacterium]